MGFLVNSNYSGTPGDIASSSIGAAARATEFNAAAQAFGGIGQAQVLGYQSKVASLNQRIAVNNASAAYATGDYETAASNLRYGRMEGTQKAAQAANGVDVNIGSPVDVRKSTETIGAMDAAMIHYNAARQAYGQQVEAANYGAQASADSMAARNAAFGGIFKAGTTLLGGAQSIQGKLAQLRLSGAVPSSTTAGDSYVLDEVP